MKTWISILSSTRTPTTDLTPLQTSQTKMVLQKLERDTLTWLMYCRATGSLVRQYIESSMRRIRRFPNARNGRVFMITALEEDPNITFCEFRMYPPMFVHFTHLLRNEYELQSGQDIDIYEQVGMFLFILAHGKGYKQDLHIGQGTWRHMKGPDIRYHFQEFPAEPNDSESLQQHAGTQIVVKPFGEPTVLNESDRTDELDHQDQDLDHDDD
ncbi:Uncharacterized protein Adt_34681 [Abeliophyllum distichum]|uniref:DUF8040 domain-containing protein n=1 Tax=Abeliophyllum distichum TaxID=126358 RepID=A0ABD1QZT0_9LAMI